MTNLQQQLAAQQQALQQLQWVLVAQRTGAAQRECVASPVGRLVGALELERSRGRIEGGTYRGGLTSRDTLDWAAQEISTLTIEDLEAAPDSVESNPHMYVARGAGLEAWRTLVRRFDPQAVGRKRTLLSRILNPGTVKVHELSRAMEQWEERVRSHQSRAREIMSDDARSGILTESAVNTSGHTSTTLVCQFTPLFVLRSKRSLKPDSRVQILT